MEPEIKISFTILILIVKEFLICGSSNLPLVINTWAFTEATKEGILNK